MEEVKELEELLGNLKGQHNSLIETFKGEQSSLIEKFKGQQSLLVEKVKELEEQNKRLKDYNAELRSTMIESPHVPHPRLINCPSSDNADEEELQDRPSSGDTNLKQPSNVFLNALVIDNLFGYLETEKLQECRLVCQEWNRIASSILRKTNGGYGPAINFDFDDSVEIFVPDVDEVIRIGELHSIVKTAPEDWFRTIELDTHCFEKLEFEIVLRDFGSQLKFVIIRSCYLEIEVLQDILVDYCPNLEKLILLVSEDFEGEASELNIPPTNALKLSNLRLDIDTDGTTQSINKISEVLITILKSSPNFKTLEISGAYTSYCTPFFKRLQLYPHIMDNLETLFIPNPFPRNRNPLHRDPLEELSEINFQSKLKRLVSTNITQKDGPALSRILKKTAESLEQLTLTSHETDKKSRPLLGPRDVHLEFSQMNNLQEFQYLIQREIPIDSIDLLAKMPNLKRFVIGFELQCSLRVERNEPMDSLFSNCHKLLITPHINLKKLYVFGFIQSPTATFGLISKCFPNLTKLGLALPEIEPKETTPDPEDNYYMELFNSLAELKHLNQLYLKWKDGLLDGNNTEFLEGFRCLKNVTKLTHLTVHNSWGLESFKYAVRGAIPKLQRLTLIDVWMSLVAAKYFQEALSEWNIFLEVKPDCYDGGTDEYNLGRDSYIARVI